MFGPAVQIYTATHPLSAVERRAGLESGTTIEIGDDAWIGGGAIICPGVRIGAPTVVGAGSVVTRNIPEDVFAAGNPCRVVRDVGQSAAYVVNIDTPSQISFQPVANSRMLAQR